MDNDRARAAWERNAGHWDDYFGDRGNLFHQMLIEPAVENLLNIGSDEYILDIACGNGVLSRRLADLGARVLAFDFSEEFIRRARARGTRDGRIEYRVIDATDVDQLLSLGRNRFDAAVANMAVMDMSTIDALFEGVRAVLKPTGRFVFSLTHPCFNATGTSVMAERAEGADGRMRVTHSIRVHTYLTPTSALGIGIEGQPQAQLYFHRSLSTLLKKCFEVGMCVDGIEEPAFPASDVEHPPLSWMAMPDIPPVLIVRARP